MTIPRIFHFVFGMRPQRNPFHLLHYLCLESCRQVNQPEAIRFYYHYEPYGALWERIKPHLTLEWVPLNSLVKDFYYQREQLGAWRYAHHSDFVRLEQLLKHGGVYADMDSLFLRPLPDHLFEEPFVMGREGGTLSGADGNSIPTLCNAFLMGEPNAGFTRLWLEEMGKSFDGSWSNHCTVLPYRMAIAYPELIHIEPISSFFYFSPSIAGVKALFEENHPIPEAAYSLHLWEHLWWDPARIDFSNFHHGRLNYRYVEAQQTTFAIAAARFLPPKPGRRSMMQSFARLWAELVCIKAIYMREIRYLVGISIYPLIVGSWPQLEPRLKWARQARLYKRGVKVLRHHDPLEASTLISILYLDDYGIHGMRFAPSDVVVDIGGGFGSFSFLCHALGSRNIRVFEPVTIQADCLERNLKNLEGITLDRRTISRSDAPALSLLQTPANQSSNTARLSRPLPDPASTSASPRHRPTLDSVLASVQRVKLLKLDCNGNGYPILLTATLLHKVDRIVGEYSSIFSELLAELPDDKRIDGTISNGQDTIRFFLESHGFEVTFKSHGDAEFFNAVRRQ